jgi:hypothetical protein
MFRRRYGATSEGLTRATYQATCSDRPASSTAAQRLLDIVALTSSDHPSSNPHLRKPLWVTLIVGSNPAPSAPNSNKYRLTYCEAIFQPYSARLATRARGPDR